MIQAETTFPTSPPVQLGGATNAFQCGSSMVVASMVCFEGSGDVYMIVWVPEHNRWFKWPVDPVEMDAMDPDLAEIVQRYVTPKTPSERTLYSYFVDTDGGAVVQVSTLLGD